jgi:hypothetical protein
MAGDAEPSVVSLVATHGRNKLSARADEVIE